MVTVLCMDIVSGTSPCVSEHSSDADADPANII